MVSSLGVKSIATQTVFAPRTLGVYNCVALLLLLPPLIVLVSYTQSFYDLLSLAFITVALLIIGCICFCYDGFVNKNYLVFCYIFVSMCEDDDDFDEDKSECTAAISAGE